MKRQPSRRSAPAGANGYFSLKGLGFAAVWMAAVIGLVQSGRAAVPAPEKLLPDDTLVVLTSPDSAKLLGAMRKTPHGQLWNDPAMRPFREHYQAKWHSDFLDPLERELGVKFSAYTNLLQGQATFALIQTSATAGGSPSFGVLLLLDAKDQSSQLKTNLAELRQKWVDAGKSLRTEKIRNVEFFALPLSTNNLPKTLRKLLPNKSEMHELGEQPEDSKAAAAKDELYVGQADSLLLLGNSPKAIDKVLDHLTGGSAPTLEGTAAFQASYQAQFRNAAAYGWINTKSFMDILTRKSAEKSDSPANLNPLAGLKPDKIATILGLNGLKSVAFSLQPGSEGTSFQLTFNVPENTRQGLFRILAGEPKEVAAPDFVPANAVKYQRLRLDGQKTWAAIEKMISDISPQALGMLNFLLDSASSNAQDKDPGFDIRKNLIGNLGDDLVAYEKVPSRTNSADPNSAPSLILVGSPNAEKLTAAFRTLLSFAGQSSGATTEREFLGRKIYSTPLPSMPATMGAGGSGMATTLHYATSGGYVAFSTDPALLEEYLRSTENPPKPLKDAPGLAEATQKVTGPGTDLFGYENEAETMRANFVALKVAAANPDKSGPDTLTPLFTALGLSAPSQDIRQWMDFSLLPPFEKVSKYFYFSVYGGSANSEGITFKYFAPVSPQLRSGAASAAAK